MATAQLFTLRESFFVVLQCGDTHLGESFHLFEQPFFIRPLQWSEVPARDSTYIMLLSVLIKKVGFESAFQWYTKYLCGSLKVLEYFKVFNTKF